MTAPSPANLMGIDLGGSSVKAVVVTPEGDLLEEAKAPFSTARSMDWGETIRELVQALEERLGGPVRHIGLSAPGLAAPNGRSIAFMPGRLEGLVGLDWTDYLQAAHPVPVLNDAQAALLGEAWLGAATDFTNVILLTLGTGVGGACRTMGGGSGREKNRSPSPPNRRADRTPKR